VALGANQTALARWGQPRETVIGKSVLEFLPGELGRARLEYMRAAAGSGRPVEFEDDRAGFHFIHTCYPVFGADGTADRVAVFSRDVTEQRKTREALQRLLAEVQAEKERLSALVNAIQDEVWFADTEKRFTLANPAAQRAFSLSAGEDVSVEALAADLEVLRADGSPRPVEDTPPLRALRGEVVTGEEEIIRTPGSGERRHRQVSAAPVRDREGSIIGSVSVVRDITDRKRADAEREELVRQLASEKERAEAILEGMRDAFLTLDKDWRITRVNRQQERVSRTSREHTLGRVFWEVWPESAAPDSKYWIEYHRVAETGAPSSFLEHFAPLDVWTDVDVFPNPDGGIAVFFRDVSERVREQEALRQSVAERRRAAEALREANEQLQDADRRKNEFLAVLSHELRNPLTPIRNGLHVLDRAAPGSEPARRALEVIGRQTGQLVRLVDDLLDVTRVSRNKVELKRSQFDLNDVVRRTVDDHRAMFGERGIGVAVGLASEPLPVDGDEARLTQVVGNLLQNAAKFTPTGGQVTVGTRAAPDRGRAVLRIVDTGVGMAPAVLRRLFQPFMQAEMTLDRSTGGLGLGLALVKSLVEMHGGEVCAHSDGPGTGAEFIIELPLDRTAAGADRTGPAAGPRVSRRVLVIEDNVDAADSLRLVLTLGGHEVRVTHTGPEGLAAARQQLPDVVLCDIGLPGMDGFQVARAFQADEALKRVVLVALSGYAQQEDLERAAEAGFHRHLAKPASPESLEEVLAELTGAAGDGSDR
jgi:PAS domain S-box-containing protein